ncbi:hypothetical protein SLA2020_497470 [Shorea laevis]
MGFPVRYTGLPLPKLFLYVLSILGYVNEFIYTLIRYLGLPDFLEPESSWTDSSPEVDAPVNRRVPVCALLICELLPVVKFSDLLDPPDSCAVCLDDFEDDDEIRRLTNCRHIFHRSCLDRWMGYHQKTCPLCRTPFVPDDKQETFNERLWAASEISEFFD